MGSLTPEADLLLQLARPSLDEATQSRTLALIPAVQDWDFFYLLATRHRLTPVVYRHLNESSAREVPRPVFMELWRNYEQNARHSRAMLLEMQRVVDLIESARVSVAAYKGPLLAHQVYGALDAREFEDIDLLVRPRDVDKVNALLVANGYRRQDELPADAEAMLRRSAAQYHLKFVHDHASIKLELHWKTDSEFPVEQDSDEWWSSLPREAIEEHSLPTFAAPDLLLVLCLHGTKHQGHRLGWIVEIAELARREHVDWTAIMAFATSRGCIRRVLVSLLLAHRLREWALPPQVAAAIASDAGISRIADDIWARLFTRDVEELQGIERLRMSLRLYDRTPQRLRHALQVALAPNLNEWSEHPLPRGLEFLYVPMRVARLIGKYGSAAVRRAGS